MQLSSARLRSRCAGRRLLTLTAAALGLARAARDQALLQLAASQDSQCSDAPSVTRAGCLQKAGAKCMWLELGGGNLCLPCEWDGIDIPCAPVGSVFAMKPVKSCSMVCAHQQVITKVSSCTDTAGAITQDQCFAKGTSALTKCMWTSYNTMQGQTKTMCGPCSVDGIGKIPPYSPGQLGPEYRSSVNGCASQCDLSLTDWGVPCDPALGIPAVTPCRPTLPPDMMVTPLPALKDESQSSSLKVLGLKTKKFAPDYWAVAVPPPYGIAEFKTAAAAGARAAGWKVGSALPPDAPLSVYGMPPTNGPNIPAGMQIMYGAAPPGIDGMPLIPGMGYGTAPPPEKDEAASLLELRNEINNNDEQRRTESLLSKARRAAQSVAL